MGMEESNSAPGRWLDDARDELHRRIADCVGKLATCARSITLYGGFHPLLQEIVSSTHQALSDLLAVRSAITLVVVDSYLTLDSFPIDDGPGVLATFAESLEARKVGEIVLSAGITKEEIMDFAEALCLSPGDLALRGGMANELKTRKVTHIEVRTDTMPAETREGKDPADIYEEALILIEEALEAVHSGLQMPVPEIKAVVEDSLASLTADEGALLALAGIRSYDRYLSEHSVNVCILSMVLGRSLGIAPGSAVELGISAMLHDVGKVFIPEQVVRKPDKLSEDEWQQVRRHPVEGARALATMQGLPTLAPTIALEHHASCDGTGYPAFGADHTPHLLSRLVAIADTYDALTTDRPYRERWSGQQAIAWMLYEATNRYDRQLMARFASRVGIRPVGSLVRLVNGQLAVVLGGNVKHPTQPTIRIISAGKKGASSRIVDLAQNTDPQMQIEALAQPVEALLPYTDLLLAA